MGTSINRYFARGGEPTGREIGVCWRFPLIRSLACAAGACFPPRRRSPPQAAAIRSSVAKRRML